MRVLHKIQDAGTPASGDMEGSGHILIPGYEAWTNVPNLNWNRDNRKVKLNANSRHNLNYRWAVPAFRESSSD